MLVGAIDMLTAVQEVQISDHDMLCCHKQLQMLFLAPFVQHSHIQRR